MVEEWSTQLANLTFWTCHFLGRRDRRECLSSRAVAAGARCQTPADACRRLVARESTVLAPIASNSTSSTTPVAPVLVSFSATLIRPHRRLPKY